MRSVNYGTSIFIVCGRMLKSCFARFEVQLSIIAVLSALISIALVPISLGQQKSRAVDQPEEVVKAYAVYEQFQRILSQNLDFNAAFEASFTTNRARQRAIAIKDGEFGDIDFATVDDQTLISAYKNRMQLIYLMLPLAGPSDEEEPIFFPPHIKAMFERKGSNTAQGFADYASQLERDARDFRAHLDRLSMKYPSVAERIRKFKSDLVTGNFRPPKSTVVTPLKYDGGGGVLSKGESYYQIEGYTVVGEGSEMKIAGIRFFTRLF